MVNGGTLKAMSSSPSSTTCARRRRTSSPCCAFRRSISAYALSSFPFPSVIAFSISLAFFATSSSRTLMRSSAASRSRTISSRRFQPWSMLSPYRYSVVFKGLTTVLNVHYYNLNASVCMLLRRTLAKKGEEKPAFCRVSKTLCERFARKESILFWLENYREHHKRFL